MDDILDFPRAEAGELDLEPAVFALRPLVADVVALVTGVSRRRGVVVDVHVDPALPERLQGPDVRIRQVLANLVGEAARFTDRGTITVDVRPGPSTEDGLCVRFEVTDTGPGVPEPMRARFSFELPLLAAPDGIAEAPTARPVGWDAIGHDAHGAAAGLRPVRILLVEDHPVNQTVTLRMIERLGHAAELAENGQEALDRLARERFDLVLMDCRMPVLDGYDATRELRRREAAAGSVRTPVVALTASAVGDERRRCADAGMDDHIAKPVTSVALSEAIVRWGRRGPARAADLVMDVAASASGAGGPGTGTAAGGASTVGDPGSGTTVGHGGGDAPEVAVFDAARLDDLAGGDQGFAAELVAMLRVESGRLMGRIDAAVLAGDVEEARSAAHALKGSSATLGFMALSEAARSLESAARAGEAMADHAERVRAHLDDVTLDREAQAGSAMAPGAGRST